MADPLTAIPPFAVVALTAALLPLLSRRAGHAVGLLATAVVVPWALLVPAGSHLPVAFLGFDAVLFNVDGFSRIMGVIFGFIGAAAVLYSASTEADGVQTAFALSYVAASLGAVFGGDWLTLLFFWELMAVTSTLLVWHYGGRAVRAGFRYALLHAFGGMLVMGAVVWHYVAVGSFLFDAATGIAPGVSAVLAAVGIGVNVGFVGLHAWLPDTYPRPHVAASVFLCVYTTKTGVYAMARAFPEGNLWVAYMGGAMAVFGASMALLQNDMRRLLSYHIQSQVGYMVAGVGIGTALATAGAMAHVFNHILYKSLLFMTVGVVIYRTGRESLKHVGGLGRVMPVTAVTFGVAALSIAGFPGFNGFVSKGMVITASHDEHLDALWVLLLLGSVGTFLSFIKLGYYAFLEGEPTDRVADANRGQTVAMVTIATLCVVFGLYPDALYPMLPGQGAAEAHPYTFGHVGEVLLIAAVAVVGFRLLKEPLHSVGRVPDVDALYNPVALYGTRAVVHGTTDAYAAVDAAAVRFTRAVYWIGENPAVAVARVSRRAPGWLVENHQPTDGGAPPTLHLRAGIGTSILLVTLVLTVVLALLL